MENIIYYTTSHTEASKWIVHKGDLYQTLKLAFSRIFIFQFDIGCAVWQSARGCMSLAEKLMSDGKVDTS